MSIQQAKVELKFKDEVVPLPSILNNTAGGSITDFKKEQILVFGLINGRILIAYVPKKKSIELGMLRAIDGKDADEIIVQKLGESFKTNILTKQGEAEFTITPIDN